MYTWAPFGYSVDINIRVHFWDLNWNPAMQAYWTRHEFARYFLNLDDDTDYKNGQGVQSWDMYIDWLKGKYDELF